MELNNSWECLTEPGSATSYFEIPNVTPLSAGDKGFNITNAWWLAELSRLIYHDNFFNDKNIQLGSLKYEKIAYIENKNTSTHVALLKIIQVEPCLVVVFRGTDEIEDWNTNVHAYQSSFDKRGKIHSGFKKAYLSIKNELLQSLETNSLPIFITGHSLGAALAVLATSKLYENEYFDSCYTFGCPRMGNPDFVNSIQSGHVYRVINNCDVVTTIPVDFAYIQYKHVGTAYLFDELGKLLKNKSEDEVYTYQKSKLKGIKDYAYSKVLDKSLTSIKQDLPAFLADHAPVNYVARLSRLIYG